MWDMVRFPYHRLPSEYAFQDLVCDVFRHLLGEGLEKFAKGKDSDIFVAGMSPDAHLTPRAIDNFMGNAPGPHGEVSDMAKTLFTFAPLTGNAINSYGVGATAETPTVEVPEPNYDGPQT